MLCHIKSEGFLIALTIVCMVILSCFVFRLKLTFFVLLDYRSLCDTKDCGKLTKEQFALAFHFINLKLLKGTDPPQVLTSEMLPPSERSATPQVRLIEILLFVVSTIIPHCSTNVQSCSKKTDVTAGFTSFAL